MPFSQREHYWLEWLNGIMTEDAKLLPTQDDFKQAMESYDPRKKKVYFAKAENFNAQVIKGLKELKKAIGEPEEGSKAYERLVVYNAHLYDWEQVSTIRGPEVSPDGPALLKVKYVAPKSDPFFKKQDYVARFIPREAGQINSILKSSIAERQKDNAAPVITPAYRIKTPIGKVTFSPSEEEGLPTEENTSQSKSSCFSLKPFTRKT